MKRSWLIPKQTNTWNGSILNRYLHKAVPFKFRGRDFSFALSQEVFSSADIDTGTRLLLKVFSQEFDRGLFETASSPAGAEMRALDAGSGCGVIGICAASMGFSVRAQDRDELARLLSAFNARQNGVSPALFSAHTEALLAPPHERWDLILSNIPAKAGKPVLEDFVPRSARLLKKGGAVIIVVVKPLGDFFRTLIESGENNALLLREEAGREHTVFVYRAAAAVNGEEAGTREDITGCPFYIRTRGDYDMEGTGYHIDSVYGAGEFDHPGGGAVAAATLVQKLGDKNDTLFDLTGEAPLLFHEPGQGHFPAWLLCRFEKTAQCRIILSGRNILALCASRRNSIRAAAVPCSIEVVPAAEASPEYRELSEAGPFGFAAIFPESFPKGGVESCWDNLTALLCPGAILAAGLPSSAAERFDRAKPAGFARLGALKRSGFRALAYRRC